MLGIVGSLMSSCSHHRATRMIARRETIFQTPASSVMMICNSRSSNWILLRQMPFTAVVLAAALIRTIFARVQKKVHTQSNPSVRTQTTACRCLVCLPAQLLRSLTWSQAGQRFTERENIWLSSSPAEGLLTCLVPWRENVRRHISSYTTTCNLWLVWWARSGRAAENTCELVCKCVSVSACISEAVRLWEIHLYSAIIDLSGRAIEIHIEAYLFSLGSGWSLSEGGDNQRQLVKIHNKSYGNMHSAVHLKPAACREHSIKWWGEAVTQLCHWDFSITSHFCLNIFPNKSAIWQVVGVSGLYKAPFCAIKTV